MVSPRENEAAASCRRPLSPNEWSTVALHVDTGFRVSEMHAGNTRMFRLMISESIYVSVGILCRLCLSLLSS